MMSKGLSKENAIQKPKLLIVEGNHERDFFTAWLKSLALSDIQIMPIGGKTLFRDNLSSLVKQRPFLDDFVSSIVIVRDADHDPQAAFASVRDAVRDVGLPVPRRCMELTTDGTLSVAIVIVPAEDEIGALEELIIKTVTDDPATPFVTSFIDNVIAELKDSGWREPTPPHKLGKAKIHAFLATFVEPDKHLGGAALGGVWNFSHESLSPLLSILQHM